MSWTLLENSLLVGALATLGAVAGGFLAALWLGGVGARVRRGVVGVAVIALALPPFLVTNTWLDLLGATGRWRGWLPLDIYSLGGAAWVLMMLSWPITVVLLLGAWLRVEPAHLEVDPALRGWPVIRWLLWPVGRAALGQSAILTLVLALNNFAVPAILQVKVLPAEVWVRFSTDLEPLAALRVGWPLIVAPLLLLFLLRHATVAWPPEYGAARARAWRRQLGPVWRGVGAVALGGLLLLSVALPLGQLVFSARTWSELPALLRASPWAIAHSFGYAAVAATVGLMVALAAGRLPLAVAWCWWLPLLTPGIFLGIALIVAFNRPGLDLLYGGAGIVILAFVIRYLALGWNGVAHALRTVDRVGIDAARLEGASRWAVLRRVEWPQIAPMAAAAWYVTYLLCLWDVETLVLIHPPGGETLALRVFNLLHYGHNAQVNAACLVLVGLAVAPLLVAAARRFALSAAVLIGCAVLAGCQPQSGADAFALDSRFFSHVEIIGSRGTGPGQFNKPRSVAVDREDNLYAVDMTGRVQKFSPAGEYLGSWQMTLTDLGKPKGMACDAAGNLVVIEPHYHRVNHYTPAGERVAVWGEHGTNAGQFSMPRAVAVASNGDLFISEYTLTERVQGFSAGNHQLLVAFGEPGSGAGEFNRAEGLGIGPGDRVYVADSCNHRIQVFSRDGRHLRSYGAPGTGPGQLSYPYDVRLDPAGFQYVCEFGNSRIQVFDPEHRPVEIIGGAGSAPGEFSNPWSIALDSRGNLYVADSQNHRVQKLMRTAN